jgi:peptidoglycan L-alanyl-D-glutamate endopeptidase CwlK
VSRRLEDLRPDVRAKCQALLDAADAEGIDLLVTCTFRSYAEQAQLYAIGRTAPGKIVTNAKPGQSKHNHLEGNAPASLAFDVVPLRMGKPVWGTLGKDGELWRRVGELGKAQGLEWAGDWQTFREFPHFQVAA